MDTHTLQYVGSQLWLGCEHLFGLMVYHGKLNFTTLQCDQLAKSKS